MKYFQRPAAPARATVCTNTCEALSGCPAWSCRMITRNRIRRRAHRRARRRTRTIRTTWIRPASAFYRRTISTLFCTTSRRDIRTSWILSKSLSRVAWQKSAFLPSSLFINLYSIKLMINYEHFCRKKIYMHGVRNIYLLNKIRNLK